MHPFYCVCTRIMYVECLGIGRKEQGMHGIFVGTLHIEDIFAIISNFYVSYSNL